MRFFAPVITSHPLYGGMNAARRGNEGDAVAEEET